MVVTQEGTAVNFTLRDIASDLSRAVEGFGIGDVILSPQPLVMRAPVDFRLIRGIGYRTALGERC